MQNLLNLVLVFHGTDNSEYDWQTQFNNRVDSNGKPIRDYQKGWYYFRNGELHFSRGQKGHFIYQTLMQTVQQKMEEWIVEYLRSKV